MSAEAPNTTKQLMFSPLKRFQRQHCQQCNRKCPPSSEAFVACVLCNLTDSVKRNNELNKLRRTHL